MIEALPEPPKSALEDQANYSRFPAFNRGGPAPSIPLHNACTENRYAKRNLK
jgi:hypothetical protein